LFSIGSFPETSLAEARQARDAARKLVKAGKSPRDERRRLGHSDLIAAAYTVKIAAEEWMSERSVLRRWTPAYKRQVVKTFEIYVYPELGKRALGEVRPSELVGILKRVSQAGVSGRPATRTALMLKGWLVELFQFAMTNARIESDPTLPIRRVVEATARKPKKAMSLDEIRSFLVRVRSSRGSRELAIALEILLLTFVRPKELRLAKWDEFDWANSMWTVPKENVKGRGEARREHVVPLSRQVVALLLELKELTGRGALLLPNSRRFTQPISETSLNRRLEHMGYRGELSAHAFRTTASTLLNDNDWPTDWIEAQLAHRRMDVRAHYNQAKYLMGRTSMLQRYADVVTGDRADSELKYSQGASV